MGLFDRFKTELVDIIEWIDESHVILVWRFPRYENEIKTGAKLIVREGQQAIFIKEGKLADVFSPGTYSLETKNLPILSTIMGWKFGFDSPWKAEVYFVSTTQFVDQKWGTKNPITIDDQRFGLIELRAFGNYNFKIVDATKFVKEVVGTDGSFNTEEINTHLRSKINAEVGVIAQKEKLSIDTFLGNFADLKPLFFDNLNKSFETYGLQLLDFNIENVSMPEEIKKEIYEYSRLSRIDMNKYTQRKAADSIETAAGNTGIAGMGMVMGVNNNLATAVGSNMQNTNTPPPLSSFFVAINGQQSGPFTMPQLQGMIASAQFNAQSLVWKQGMASWSPASAVPELQGLFPPTPPPIPM
jgi:membrane protease subunit (stomatin/prohibitin family)